VYTGCFENNLMHMHFETAEQFEEHDEKEIQKKG